LDENIHPSDPYAPPKGSSLAEPPASLMYVNLGIVGTSAGAGAVLGMLLGMLIALVFPGYYRAVFSPKVNEFDVGAGLGLIQGSFVGILAGLGVVALHYWHRLGVLRQQRTQHQLPPSDISQSS